MSLRPQVWISADLLLRVSIEQSSSSFSFANRWNFNNRIGNNEPCYAYGVKSGAPSDWDTSKEQEWQSRRQWLLSRRHVWTTSGRYFLKIRPWTVVSYDGTTCRARWAKYWLLSQWKTSPTVYFGKQRCLLHASVTLTATTNSRYEFGGSRTDAVENRSSAEELVETPVTQLLGEWYMSGAAGQCRRTTETCDDQGSLTVCLFLPFTNLYLVGGRGGPYREATVCFHTTTRLWE